MSIVGLQHFNITAPVELLEKVRDFYVEVLGLEVGARPDFMRKGFWLYAGKEPLVHLTACAAEDERAAGTAEPGFFDHIAFACKGLPEVIARLKHFEIHYEVDEVPALGQVQLFLRDPAGVGVELNFTDETQA
jgi:catechol 2,3-dioxygenase-like lactoylglutathione lyase family enzyme